MQTFMKNRTSIRQCLGAAALFTVAAVGAWGIAYTTALAPEPVLMLDDLTPGIAAMEPGLGYRIAYDNSPDYKIVRWGSSFSALGSAVIPDGTPCVTGELLTDEATFRQMRVFNGKGACLITAPYSNRYYKMNRPGYFGGSNL